ncbi:MAG: hypothetical protein JSW65_06810 [Candidatus Bipolaricaulota bacterium]|nr:MAG: hypothetical protein JSW65_06810 [Candidatus Bipolaricaulota bacterium]
MRRALVLALAAVVVFTAAALADMLSGSWSTEVCLNAVPAFTLFTSDLLVTYEVCNWAFSAALGFGLTGWETVSFTASGVLGAFSFASELIFDPATATFTSWSSDMSVNLAGVNLDFAFDMDDVGVQLVVGIGGDVGLCTLGASAQFGDMTDCTFAFIGLDLDFGFPFACIEWVDVTVSFGCGTFDGICFEIQGLKLSGIDWLVFDFTVCFDDGEDGKTFTFIPDLNLGAYDCITLYAELVTGIDYEFEGIDIYGVEIFYEWNGVYFQSVSSFDPTKHDLLIHPSELYWEVICIGSIGDSCCGGGFDFEVCTYFDDTSTWLFDWGLTTISLGFSIGSNFAVTASLDVDGTGLVEMCLGFDVNW